MRHQTFFRRLGAFGAAVLLSGLIGGAASAASTPAAGGWSGRLDSGSVTGAVTFRVQHGNQVTSLLIRGGYGTLHCGGTVTSGSTIGSATISIRSVSIAHNSAGGTFVRHSGGQTETDHLSMRFSGHTVRGTISQSFDPQNCATPTLHFTAHAGPFPNAARPGAVFHGSAYDGSAVSFRITPHGQRVTQINGSFPYDCNGTTGVLKLSLGKASTPIDLGFGEFNEQLDLGDVGDAQHVVLTFSGSFTGHGRQANGSLGAAFTTAGTQCSGNQVWQASS